jgi:hypothetical protein
MASSSVKSVAKATTTSLEIEFFVSMEKFNWSPIRNNYNVPSVVNFRFVQ